MFQASDERLKDGIAPIEDALDLVGRLRGVRYTLKADGTPQIGLVAQEVREVVPEIMAETGDGMLGIAYGNALALAISAINEPRARVEALEAKAAA